VKLNHPCRPIHSWGTEAPPGLPLNQIKWGRPFTRSLPQLGVKQSIGTGMTRASSRRALRRVCAVNGGGKNRVFRLGLDGTSMPVGTMAPLAPYQSMYMCPSCGDGSGTGRSEAISGQPDGTARLHA
jgi:hypothetical protein